MTGRGPAGSGTPGPPGAQWERTRLAWRRTGLASSVVAVLTLRQALLADSWLGGVGTVLTLSVWLAGLVAAHRRAVALRQGVLATGAAPLTTAVVTVGFGVLGLALLIPG